MKKTLRRIETAAIMVGFDARRGARFLRELPRFLRDRQKFYRQAPGANGVFSNGKPYPCLDNRLDSAGAVGGHYFHQDLYVAQRIFQKSPRHHVDVGSRVDGFVAHVASFREIDIFDIRPLTTTARGLHFRQADITQADSLPAAYADSVSCLHALEHFGLGRYGDPIDYYGYRTGWANLVRTVEPRGTLYVSVPIGPQRIEFNAHRVFSVGHILELASQSSLVLDSFAFVDDAGDLHTNVALDEARIRQSCGCYYGCGIFEFRKPDAPQA